MSKPDWPSWAVETIELVEHDSSWARMGALMGVQLQRLLEPWLVDTVEHVGSTAVPGLSAKPIIDLQAAVRDLAVADEVDATLAAHGWHYVPPELDQRPYRRFFVQVADDRRMAHLHLMLADGDRRREQLVFRNALRSDPGVVQAYAQLKAQLAQDHGDDREAYSVGKSQFVADVIRGASTDG